MTSIQQIVRSFAVYQKNLASFPLDSSLRWLWEHRIPLAGITLLDGDHGTGKSLLSLSLAAHVSYGNPMPGDTRTLFSGGVVIVTPNIHATASQIQCLSHMSANLSRIEFLSFVPQSTPDSDPQSYRPFSLPEDIPLLLEAIERVDARLSSAATTPSLGATEALNSPATTTSTPESDLQSYPPGTRRIGMTNEELRAYRERKISPEEIEAMRAWSRSFTPPPPEDWHRVW